MDYQQLAANVLQLLQADPKRYKLFGVYWFLVKAVLKRFYTRDNLYLLGDYVDSSVTDRMPAGLTLDQAMTAALEEYQQNFSYELGGNPVDPDGEEFILIDTDAGM